MKMVRFVGALLVHQRIKLHKINYLTSWSEVQILSSRPAVSIRYKINLYLNRYKAKAAISPHHKISKI